MPKRALPPAVTNPVNTLIAPLPPSPLVQRLRKDWKWAAISQFLWMFSDAFVLVDWDIELLEADLDGDETALLPDLIAKLLYALTYNRQINRDNAMDNLRKQCLKRSPEGASPLGTIEEPIEWATLGLGQKVDILFHLCEWQMEDAARFRALLKSEDDATSWRIDPVGWDKPGNTYYLFDDNRLWIQRAPPVAPAARPVKKTSQKAKREAKRARAQAEPVPKKAQSAEKKSHRKREFTPEEEALPPPTPEPIILSGPRKRTQVAFYGNPTPTGQALKRGAPSANGTPTRSTRNHPLLDAAEETTAATNGSRSSKRGGRLQPAPPSASAGSSSKSRRNTAPPPSSGSSDLTEEESELSDLTDEEEHQATLKLNGIRSSRQDTPLTPLESTREGSEVSGIPPPPSHHSDEDFKPTDEDVEMEDQSTPVTPKAESVKDEAAVDEFAEGLEAAKDLPEDFVEWEAICVNLYDWRTFPEQFAKSRHPDEKALYRVLTEEVGPTVIEALMAKEQERIKQEAINNRKRSSRIATRELEKEEIARREQAQREMEERMERSRQEEARKEKEERELLAREKAREDRLKEREERIAARENAIVQKALAEQEAKEKADKARERRLLRRERGEPDYDSEAEDSGANTPVPRAGEVKAKAAAERWELNCEVCKKNGWNLDEEQDLVCCETCNRWQHVECHDRLDMAEGRPKRNWDTVDFTCRECRRKAARDRPRTSDPTAAPAGPKPLFASHPPPHLQGVAHPLSHPPAAQPRALPPPIHQLPPSRPPQHSMPANGHPHPMQYPHHPQHPYYNPGQHAPQRPPPGPNPNHYPPNPYIMYQGSPQHQPGRPPSAYSAPYSPQPGSQGYVPRAAYPSHPYQVQRPPQQNPLPYSQQRSPANGHEQHVVPSHHGQRSPHPPKSASGSSPPSAPSQSPLPPMTIPHASTHPFAAHPQGYRPDMRYPPNPPNYGSPNGHQGMPPFSRPPHYPSNGHAYRPHPSHPPHEVQQAAYAPARRDS